MKTENVEMELTEYKKTDDGRYKVYKVRHFNEKTCLEQEITLTEKSLYKRWEVSLGLDDFPHLESETDALLKLSDWLERLGIAIRREAKRAVKRGTQ